MYKRIAGQSITIISKISWEKMQRYIGRVKSEHIIL